jgi:hypothetical protein
MLEAKIKKILQRLPVPREEYEEMRLNPPIRTVDPATISGSWDVRMIEETVKENLYILTQPSIDVWRLMRSAQHTLALYMEMCFPGKECRDQELIDAIIATGYQLAMNLMTAGPRIYLQDSGNPEEPLRRVVPEIYDVEDDTCTTATTV